MKTPVGDELGQTSRIKTNNTDIFLVDLVANALNCIC